MRNIPWVSISVSTVGIRQSDAMLTNVLFAAAAEVRHKDSCLHLAPAARIGRGKGREGEANNERISAAQKQKSQPSG